MGPQDWYGPLTPQQRLALSAGRFVAPDLRELGADGLTGRQRWIRWRAMVAPRGQLGVGCSEGVGWGVGRPRGGGQTKSRGDLRRAGFCWLELLFFDFGSRVFG